MTLMITKMYADTLTRQAGHGHCHVTRAAMMLLRRAAAIIVDIGCCQLLLHIAIAVAEDIGAALPVQFSLPRPANTLWLRCHRHTSATG